MATTKNRLNISLSKELDEALSEISKRDKMPRATKAAELLRLALEIEEDKVWGMIAEERMKYKGKLISHKDAWK